MPDVTNEELQVAFSAQDFANECCRLLRAAEYVSEPISRARCSRPDFPEAHWHTTTKPDQQFVSFFVAHSDLNFSLDEFSEKFLRDPIDKLRQKCGSKELILKTEPFEIPETVDFAAASTSNEVRVIMVEDPVPDSPSGKMFWPQGKVKFYFDVNKDTFFKGAMAPVIRIDVRVAE